jgi:two-component system, OmpR family, sensor histidine kinase KdpD
VGLGLAICQAIVRAHGGEIEAQRREGGGARFVFTLPATQATAESAA